MTIMFVSEQDLVEAKFGGSFDPPITFTNENLINLFAKYLIRLGISTVRHEFLDGEPHLRVNTKDPEMVFGILYPEISKQIVTISQSKLIDAFEICNEQLKLSKDQYRFCTIFKTDIIFFKDPETAFALKMAIE